MKKLIFTTIIIAVSLFGMNGFAAPCAHKIRIMSWNVMHLDVRPDQKDIRTMGSIVYASGANLIAIQETDWAGKSYKIHGEHRGVMLLRKSIEKATGQKWGSVISSPVGSMRHKEHYVFLYQKNMVWTDGKAVVYPDKGKRFMREPAAVKFNVNGFDFVLINIHVVYGKHVADRRNEVQLLDQVVEYYKGVFRHEGDIFIVGDFNLHGRDKAWRSLQNHGYVLSQKRPSPSTLGYTARKNDYDHLVLPARNRETMHNTGVFDYTGLFNLSYAEARKRISDHLPLLSDFCTDYGDDD